MPERPIILFPQPEIADRERPRTGFHDPHRPTASEQFDRFSPKFSVLQRTIENKTILVQTSTVGIEPEYALVFETIGSIDAFYNSVKYIVGLEWMFDIPSDSIEPDERFFFEDEQGDRTEKELSGRIYCVMTNREALNQLISLWTRYKDGEDGLFQRGSDTYGQSALRDVFLNLKDIRLWNAMDRIAETNIEEYWYEQLTLGGDTPIPFEIELFYRATAQKRGQAVQSVGNELESMGGRIIKQSTINEIAYHGLLVELAPTSVSRLVENLEDVALVQIDDIMFFRPVCQSASLSTDEATPFNLPSPPALEQPLSEPIIAIFDGMPLQNHAYLLDRVVVDDPDSFETNYESRYRKHGTAMASLSIYGDLSHDNEPLRSKVYIRPILKPVEQLRGFIEEVPSDELIVDLIHRAVVHLFGDEGVVPTVKVINLSIGDKKRMFINSVSPLARLLDWLSSKYNVLFIVSAGNHPEPYPILTISFSDFKNLSDTERTKQILPLVKENLRNQRLLSPSESLNALTVGAIYNDDRNEPETDRHIYATSNQAPAPYGSFGYGNNVAIKPDIFYKGGRNFVQEGYPNGIISVDSFRPPGCKVAAPSGDGALGCEYTYGTSDSTAQITYEAGKCHEVLKEVFLTETGDSIPDKYAPSLIKAMLVHGATWKQNIDLIAEVVGISKNRAAQWLGNGVPDVQRVKECTSKRITLIGVGELEKGKGHVFHLPLDIDFGQQKIFRRLVVTLAYLSSIDSKRQKYRGANLWFENLSDSRLCPDRQNTDWRSVRRGTLQHEIFTGDDIFPWSDGNHELRIKVNCKEDAITQKRALGKIPYGLFVTFEIAEGLNIDLYSMVVESLRLQNMVPINT
jgi:hypothetical protein